MPCTVCGGRVIKTETGKRCMNPACDGAKADSGEKSIDCRCGATMNYTGLTQLGEPKYSCPECNRVTKL